VVASLVTRYIFESGRCSAIIKVLGDFSNVFVGHATWWSYRAMIRIMKNYKTNLSTRRRF
jgi:hypothetical protein